jgi:hypothetical protein
MSKKTTRKENRGMSRGQAGNDGREGLFFYPWERTLDRLVTPFEEFIHRQTAGGMIMPAPLLSALVGYLWLRFLCPQPMPSRKAG